MNFKIILFLFLIQSSFVNAQWKRTGFDSDYINDTALMEDKVIVPARSIYYGQTNFYGSKNYGESWDSLGYINIHWIYDVEVTDQYIFSSYYWACTDFCSPRPCIFRSNENWISWDTLYIKEFGVSNLLVHDNIIFANEGNSFIKSTDYGISWEEITTIPATNGQLFSVDSLLFLITRTNPIFISEDNGLSWQLFNNDLPAKSICVVKNNSYLVFGGVYGIARFKNDAEWELSNTGLPINLRIDHLVAKDNIIFAVGTDTIYKRFVFYSPDDGKNWFNTTEGLELETFEWINSILIQDHYLFVAAKGIWRYDFSSLVHVVDQDANSVVFNLYQNYPNPFNPSTKISAVASL